MAGAVTTLDLGDDERAALVTLLRRTLDHGTLTEDRLALAMLRHRFEWQKGQKEDTCSDRLILNSV